MKPTERMAADAVSSAGVGWFGYLFDGHVLLYEILGSIKG